MMQIFELTLNYRDLIISKVIELCNKDSYITKGCYNSEIIQNIVHVFADIVFDTRQKQSTIITSKNIDEKPISALILSGVDFKLLIIVLKYFRNIYGEVIFKDIEYHSDKYNYFERILTYFDSIEFVIYSCWLNASSEERVIKKIFDKTPFGFFILEDGAIIYANSIFEKISGYSRTELVARRFDQIIHPNFLNVLKLDSIRKALSEESFDKLYECMLINKKNNEVWVEVSVSKIKLDGREYIMGTAIDITEYKTIEGLKIKATESAKLLNDVIENDKIKIEFLLNLAHELRTPLNVILGSLQLVELYSSKIDDTTMGKTNKYYKIMRQNCYRLLRLVNNLIDMNKLEAGYMQLCMNNHDIVNIVSKISASVADYIENKNIMFEYCSEIESQVIYCDPDKIERIILNLLSNAVKFTDCGGKINVRLWKDDDNVYISVKDNGIGIQKDKQNQIFKRFSQVDKSLSRNYQGSGIGLSLVKSLVELQDGKISLISDTGLGCDFIVEMPIKQNIVAEQINIETQYSSNNRIEIINIEFSDIYS